MPEMRITNHDKKTKQKRFDLRSGSFQLQGKEHCVDKSNRLHSTRQGGWVKRAYRSRIVE